MAVGTVAKDKEVVSVTLEWLLGKCVSYSTVVFFVLSRKKKILTSNQPHNTFMVPLQHWISTINPKSVFKVANDAKM